MKNAIKTFLLDEEGLTTVEYAIAGGLVGAAVIVAFQTLGGTVGGVIEYIDGELAANTPAP
jgi:pilus assembly protein Flp/PilA